MEALILAIIIAYAVKKAAEQSHGHWQGARAANRKASAGKPARKRAASAVQHDAGYWLHQVLNGFPQVRHGLAMGWHAGRAAQDRGAETRRKARTEHLERQVNLLDEIREHRRRQAEALERIRAAAAPEPVLQNAAEHQPDPGSWGGSSAEVHDRGRAGLRPGETPGSERLQPLEQSRQVTPSTPAEGNTMPGDTNYTQQMAELEAIRRDAEEEVNSVARKRMTSRLDILQSLGLDKDTLSEAAEIDDALQAQEKAAQRTLDAVDAAISGLAKRHGNIKEAVDSSPVDKPAEPEFYQD